MPVWLQFVSVLISGLLSGIMGIALIPFLEKSKFCLPEKLDDKNTINNIKLRPTMGGILLLFGTVAGLVINYTLYLQFGGADRTGADFQTESHVLWLLLGYLLIISFAGLGLDYFAIKKNLVKLKKSWQFSILFLVNFVLLKLLPEQILDFGFWKWNAGILSVIIRAVLLAIFWQMMQIPEQETDGMSISLNTVQLLCLNILLLAEKQNLYALYSFTVIGACMGCMFWNLHPAKCKLGNTGLFFLGAVLPVLSMLYGKIYIILLYMIVYVIILLPMLTKKTQRKNLIVLLKNSGYEPLQRIALLAGFAIFCGVLTILLETS